MRKPAIPLPERVLGWQGLSDWLLTIGLQRTAAALCERARRRDLPYGGGGLPGSSVFFDTGHLQAWVRDLVGVDLDLWVEQHARNLKRAPPPRPRAKGPRPAGPWKHLRARREHYVLLRRCSHGEEVLRGSKGTAFVATSVEAVDRWPQRFLERADAVVLLRRFRLATQRDFAAPPAHTPKPPYLLAAFRMWKSRLEPVQVRAAWFGVRGEGVVTPAVVSPAHPRLAEIRAEVGQGGLPAIWIVWEERVDLDPVTLEPAPARAAPQGGPP